MLTLETLAALRSSNGERLLATAAELQATAQTPLQALMRLRERCGPELAGAALETIALRRRGARKFSRAARMFFSPDGLEQASSEPVARHGAARFAGYDSVLDLCCGIGGDTLALATVTRVIAVDRDPLRLALAEANAEAYGLADRIRFVQADALDPCLPAAAAAFCDPGRRSGAGRTFDVRAYQPPLQAVLGLTARYPALGVKVAPGIRDRDVPAGCEAEFVQLDGELKQGTLWLGSLATAERRATLLPGGATLALAETANLAARPPRSVLYEPALAIIRAHLIGQLGAELDASQLDPTTAFLSGDSLRETPFARAYLVDEWLPFNLGALRRRLRELRIGSVAVKTRASPLDPQALERQLRLSGVGEQRILILTRVLGRHSAIICRRV